ncbi:MAG: winged helix-turn-helix domain-containing protein [Candidatus Pseudomonas colombiensis]|nr:MAG: winged helix-turn-helix domain-containing protein [Pseudomonas sp.]
MRPVLTTVQNGAPLPLSELRERIADQFQLTEEERKEHLPSGHQTVINNRVGWAPNLSQQGRATHHSLQGHGANHPTWPRCLVQWTRAHHRELAETIPRVR